jgi:hypothetical protein
MVSERALRTADRHGPCVRPLIVEERDAWKAVGSGVLLSVRSSVFLLTAAHVIDRWAALLHITGDRGPVPIRGEALTSVAPEGKREKDRIDAAVIRLDRVIAERLQAVPTVVPADLALDERVADARKHYLLIGFPSTRAKLRRWERVLKCEGFVLTAVAAPTDSYSQAGVTDDSNIVLVFDPDDLANADGKVTAPKLNGISGGAIWSFGPTYHPEGADAKLVAIVTERHRGTVGAIVGTRIAMFLAIIWQHYPDLADSIPRPSRMRIRVKGPGPKSPQDTSEGQT